MWHEARRQEKKIRKVIVDYRKRSERRHLYYERIKQDPTKFLQVHGRKCKIHLDGTVASEADNNNHMIPWQGDSSNMIDRFDVRTHLDFYRDAPKSEEPEEFSEEEQKCSFERYRVLIWNEHKNVSELQHLRQIHIDEQFPEIAAQQKQRQDAEAQKQMLAQTKASIGYDYGGGTALSSVKLQHNSRNRVEDDDADLDEEEDELDFLRELEEIPPLSDINMDSIKALDDIGVKKYKMRRGGFGDCLLDDQDYLDKVGEAKAIESEKQKFSGRKSRRERRILKDERLRGRKIGELSYVRRDANKMDKNSDSGSTSSSSSSDPDSDDEDGYNGKKQKSNTIEYITSFGDEVEKSKTPAKRPMKTSTLKDWKHSESSSSSSEDESPAKSRRRRSRSRSSSSERYRSRHRRSRSSSRSRYRRPSGSGSHRDDRSRRSRSSSWGRSQRRSRSRSRSRRSRSRGRRSYSRERRSRTPESKYKSATATISSTSSILKGKTKESKAAAIKKLTPQERLKIKMQRALNKQLKVDRNVEMEKRMVKEQEQLDREEDLREMSRKMRKRERGEDEQSMKEYADSHC